jgi:hypothetical protein
MRSLEGVHALAALCVFGALLTSCLNPAGPDSPQLTVTLQKQEDRATVTTEGRSVVIDVSSPSGIGGAGVTIGPGPMPRQILIRFHLKGLEHLEFRYGGTVVVVSLPTSGGEPSESVSRAGAAETPVGPDSQYWMAVRPPSGGSAQDGYIEVAVPPDFLAGSNRAFSLKWIDFYR